ncbi:hypothetical protein ACFYPC_09635 [Streptomyces sp. NPDC005808]|uniref:hypothetical protein n=1 Tax=Streptomyces sp. NPDC005808 TaxID=3364734 RepID=UPI003680B071
MRDWLFIVDPTDTTMDGDHSSKDRVLELAKTAPRREWWLARRRHMAPGDRIWIYFATPVKEVAAVAEVEGVPYEVTGDAEYPWRFPAVLNLEATRALYRAPVPLAALANQHPQGVRLVKDAELELFLTHAEL